MKRYSLADHKLSLLQHQVEKWIWYLKTNVPVGVRYISINWIVIRMLVKAQSNIHKNIADQSALQT